MYIAGKRVAADTQTVVETASGEQISISTLAGDHVAKVSQPSLELRSLPLDEIIAFLHNVGQNWKRRDYVRRTVYERNMVRFLGLSPQAARHEADWIALLLSSSARIHDILTAELGSAHVVDGWVPRDEAFIKAVPRGVILHLAPSNVPLSAVISLIRTIATKNTSVIKMSAGDPFTPVALLQSFIDIDERHPVTRSVSVVYWPSKSSEVGAQVAQRMDGIVVWGGREALDWAHQFASLETEVIPFGPKRSLAVVSAAADLAAAAEAVAIDVGLYDQGACFSTREVFIEAPLATAFRPLLAAALARVEAVLPARATAGDQAALRSLARAHLAFFDAEQEGSAGDPWYVAQSDRELALHPLGRTVIVREFSDVEEVAGTIDSSVQTVSVFPWELGLTLRDRCAEMGVSRVVEAGLSNLFRVGGAHDGIYPLQRLVRFCSNELPSRTRVRGIHVPVKQLEFLEADRFLEFVP